MLTDFKQLVKRNQSDIVLAVSVVLVAVISFAIGYLLADKNEPKPIIIEKPILQSQSASVEKSLNNDIKLDVQAVQVAGQGVFVGSVNSDKYHWPDCPWAKKIAPQNQIWFDSEKEAQAAGYVRCGSFDKYNP